MKNKTFVIVVKHFPKTLPPSYWYDYGWTRNIDDAKKMNKAEAEKLAEIIKGNETLQLHIKGFGQPIVEQMGD